MHFGSESYWNDRGFSKENQSQRWFLALRKASLVLLEIGKFDEAIEVLEALSWGDETYECGDYAFELGRCYEAKGDLAEALRYYEIALRENPPVLGRKEAVARLKAIL